MKGLLALASDIGYNRVMMYATTEERLLSTIDNREKRGESFNVKGREPENKGLR